MPTAGEDELSGKDDAVDPGRVTAELRSGDPVQVAHALAELDHACLIGRHVPLPLPSADCLTTFGEDLPEEIVDRFVRVVNSYVPFEPPPEPSERQITALDAVLRYGPGQPVFEVAMFVRIDDDPDWVVKDVMRHIPHYPAETESELAVVEQLLGHLLDARSTREATVNGLAAWAFRGDYPTVVDNLLPQLSDTERDRILKVRRDDPA